MWGAEAPQSLRFTYTITYTRGMHNYVCMCMYTLTVAYFLSITTKLRDKITLELNMRNGIYIATTCLLSINHSPAKQC